jgi:hypothetical protein
MIRGGCPGPSPEDISKTKNLIEGGNILGIIVKDHVVIGYKSYQHFSFIDHSMLSGGAQIQCVLPRKDKPPIKHDSLKRLDRIGKEIKVCKKRTVALQSATCHEERAV